MTTTSRAATVPTRPSSGPLAAVARSPWLTVLTVWVAAVLTTETLRLTP